jgi:hypothetical protein
MVEPVQERPKRQPEPKPKLVYWIVAALIGVIVWPVVNGRTGNLTPSNAYPCGSVNTIG